MGAPMVAEIGLGHLATALFVGGGESLDRGDALRGRQPWPRSGVEGSARGGHRAVDVGGGCGRRLPDDLLAVR